MRAWLAKLMLHSNYDLRCTGLPALPEQSQVISAKRSTERWHIISSSEDTLINRSRHASSARCGVQKNQRRRAHSVGAWAVHMGVMPGHNARLRATRAMQTPLPCSLTFRRRRFRPSRTALLSLPGWKGAPPPAAFRLQHSLVGTQPSRTLSRSSSLSAFLSPVVQLRARSGSAERLGALCQRHCCAAQYPPPPPPPPLRSLGVFAWLDGGSPAGYVQAATLSSRPVSIENVTTIFFIFGLPVDFRWRKRSGCAGRRAWVAQPMDG